MQRGERSPLLERPESGGAAQQRLMKMRGAPSPATSTGYYPGLTALLALGALGMGGLAFYLYYGPTKVAAALIAKYQVLQKLLAFWRVI